MMVYILMEHAFFDLQVGKNILKSLPSIAIHLFFSDWGGFPLKLVAGRPKRSQVSQRQTKNRDFFTYRDTYVIQIAGWLIYS